MVGLSKEEVVPGRPGGGMTLSVDKAVPEKRAWWRAWKAGDSKADCNRARINFLGEVIHFLGVHCLESAVSVSQMAN